MAAAAFPPVSAQIVANAFVQQYYHIQHESPGLVHRFYKELSKLGRPEDDGTMSMTTTMQAIDEKILSLNYGEYRAEIKSVDAQESYMGGVHVLVSGYLAGKDKMIRNFTQTFFLAPQEKGYFVLNDMFRYVEDTRHGHGSQNPGTDEEASLTPEQDHSPVQEIHVPEHTMPSIEVNGEEALNPADDGEVSVEEEEVSVAEVVTEVVDGVPDDSWLVVELNSKTEEASKKAEVVDEVPDDSQLVVESNSKIEDVPKKSYASIVMDMKEGAMQLSSPVPAPRRSVATSREQQVNLAQASASVAETPVSGSDTIEDSKNQEEEDVGYSIYIKGLPFNATPTLLEDEFKRFGAIKSGGIQVRSNQQQGFSFGFVEFEVASAVQKAIEASPIIIGGRRAFVEEKRSTINSRVNVNRGRFPGGREYGSRNDEARGHGNYGASIRGNRRDFNGGRTELGNFRVGNRGGFSNRGADGYQRADNNMGSNGGRMNRGAGGMAATNGTAKTVAPQVSATA